MSDEKLANFFDAKRLQWAEERLETPLPPVEPMTETGDLLDELPGNRKGCLLNQHPYNVFFPTEPLLP